MRKVKSRGSRVIAAILTVVLMIQPIIPQVHAVDAEGRKVMVSMGDSYSSGEGIEKFYGQDDELSEKVNNPDWLAHRSQNSWPGQLKLTGEDGVERLMSDGKDEYWYFVAASGATTANFPGVFTKNYNKSFYKGSYDLAPQLDIFDELGSDVVDYVTVTIGGNDAGFANIVESCFFEGRIINKGKTADKLDYTWQKFAEKGGIKDKLIDTYKNIAEKAGPQAQIIVAGYPKLLDKEGRGLFFKKSEADLVNDAVSDFNKAIEDIVNSLHESGVNISFVSVEEAFDGHEAYSDDPYIYGINYISESEDLKLDFKSAYSMHPNEKGAAAYTSCVQSHINDLEKLKTQSNATDKEGFTNNPEATDDEIKAEEIHFSGVVLSPEDVVLKMFDALQTENYEDAAECFDPATEQQIDFWGGLASSLVALFTGEFMSWGQLLADTSGATDVDVIECYSDNLSIESNLDIINAFVPEIPAVRNLFCTEADVYIKYRYKDNDKYYIQEEVCRVRRYEWSGWRIDLNESYS